ncbi:MAG TPA: hypothetical protein VGQ57_11950, partial [Polyangiaceae bacterium]|nr:hypothetical protein [Polyangiaceae bacterium]
MRAPFGTRRAWCLALACALAPSACHARPDNVMPQVSLAEDAPAQAEFRVLRAQFFDADGPGRVKLLGRLSDFLVRFPSDPRTFDIEVYLVWARLESGDRDGARAVLEPLLKGEDGPRLDFARVAAAAIKTRSGQAKQALSDFDLLEGKLVDLDERFVYGEERARAAFLAGAYERAVEALLGWLVQAPPDRQGRARNTAATLLALAPSAELVHALAVLRRNTDTTSPDLEMARGWLASTIARELTDLALERADSDLARRLLDAAPAALRATPEGQRLVALAAAAPKGPAVAGRAIGLLLSLGGPTEQRRAAAVAAGITRALGSTRSENAATKIELLVRYDTDDVDAALDALAADGASLFVAGNDDETARKAAARAERLGVPLLLLRPHPKPPAPDGYTFVLGADDAAVERELLQALAARGHRDPGRVGVGGTSCSVEPASPGKPRFPLALWKKADVDALLVTGDADCARDLASEVAAGRQKLLLALGLDASVVAGSVSVPTLTPAAGTYPEKAPPGGWYEALGHDAAVLAAR